MGKAKSFDRTVRRLCNRKIIDTEQEILGESFSVEQAIAAALIKKAMGGAADAVKLIREILDQGSDGATGGSFRIDVNVVE